MSDLSQINIKPQYRSGESDLIGDFYSPCLTRANNYDRAVGYFRSTVLLLINYPLQAFVQRNGKIRIICSNELAEEDVVAIQKGYKSREDLIGENIIREIDSLGSVKEASDRLEVLATLVSFGIVDIKIAFTSNEYGLYHEKIGLFYDESNAISFIGSANETLSGWAKEGNYESLVVFTSWNNESDKNRVENHRIYFNNLWSNLVPGIDVYDFPLVAIEKFRTLSKDGISDIKWEELKIQSPKKQHAKIPFEYQSLAIENWENNNYCGILQHATGSGKTITSLIAIKKHICENKPVIILVPSKLLQVQWEEEVKFEIPHALILLVGGGNTSWKKNNKVKSFTRNSNESKPRIIIAVLKTASKQEFISNIEHGDHLFVVADEVHESGSIGNSNVYSIWAGKKLGLSATPVRYGDPEGTARMFEYFGDIVPPIFSLDDAIKAKRLVPYQYFPTEVNLDIEEEEEWDNISKRISKEIAMSHTDSKGDKVVTDRAKKLLIQRSRIAKKAKSKIEAAINIIQDHYQNGDKWLVYCEDKDQLTLVLNKLQQLEYHVNEYHTSMESDKDSTLSWYKKHGGILVSIRCLDQGVDIPDISHALILASSQNPRQFIQRRGRVLRKHEGKYSASIYDVLVIPRVREEESEQFALVKSEFSRAIVFSKGAINKTSEVKLMDIALEFGLDIDISLNNGEEED